MSDYTPSKYDHLYEGEPWAEIVKAAGIAPGNAEAQARRVASVAAARLAETVAENADLRESVIAFGAPYMARWAEERGFPPGHLHPQHYDLLASCGARMDSFTRAALAQPKEPEHD